MKIEQLYEKKAPYLRICTYRIAKAPHGALIYFIFD